MATSSLSKAWGEKEDGAHQPASLESMWKTAIPQAKALKLANECLSPVLSALFNGLLLWGVLGQVSVRGPLKANPQSAQRPKPGLLRMRLLLLEARCPLSGSGLKSWRASRETQTRRSLGRESRFWVPFWYGHHAEGAVHGKMASQPSLYAWRWFPCPWLLFSLV